MSKYDDIAKISSERAKRFFEERTECERYAFELIRGLADYLEAPKDAITYMEVVSVDPWQIGDKQHSVRNGLPRAKSGPDGFWYFGVYFCFEQVARSTCYYNHGCGIGIKKQGDEFLVRYDSEKVHVLKASSRRNSFFEAFTKDSLESIGLPSIDDEFADRAPFGFPIPETKKDSEPDTPE